MSKNVLYSTGPRVVGAAIEEAGGFLKKKVMAFCCVPEGSEGETAGEWLKRVLAEFGGRGGGTDTFASGQCTVEDAENVCAKALEGNVMV